MLEEEKGKEFSHPSYIIADVVVGFKMNLVFLSGNTIVYINPICPSLFERIPQK